MTTVADLLEEYGSAIRGSWAYLDGRSVRMDLDRLAELVRTYANGDVPHPEVERDFMDLCPEGSGHWTEFCDAHLTDPTT